MTVSLSVSHHRRCRHHFVHPHSKLTTLDDRSFPSNRPQSAFVENTPVSFLGNPIHQCELPDGMKSAVRTYTGATGAPALHASEPTTTHQPPSTTNHQPPTANHPPPTTNHQPPSTTNHQPLTTVSSSTAAS